ncbi:MULTISPECIES: oligosaccharide flippase family protein [unclassified Ruegeria]|uniref:oligosaccharide flippase family protein n=1 Tax=unclassified Ruegeria TaxID=2625375 RepID=UPI00149296C2|nr:MULTISPECIES: oligosaccharide flippase family protein [unclassified Ruegeria]NOD36579.1 oligosaccharide flippase family protein [Ruegeria sp. HKCCD7296]NOE43819.1 oligosaccharide flippase family protein [Ruegeria sp. HKCCD7319]
MKKTSETHPKSSTLTRSSALAVGVATLLASSVFRQALGFFTLAFTARLLRPEDFGIIAYFMIAVALFEMLQRQIGLVLIRIDNVNSEHLNTVFTFQFVFGITTAFLLWTIQPLVALLNVPQLLEVLPYLSALSILVSLRSPRFLLYERSLRFSQAAVEETLNRIAYSATALYMVWLWRDFWAVLVAVFVGMAVRSAITFAIAPMLPKLSVSRWRDCLAFSSWSAGAQLSQFLANNMPQLFIGATLGLADAGLYRVGTRITEVVTTHFIAPLQRVIYPGLADVARSTDRRREAFIKLNALLLAIVLPVSVGTALVCKDVILVGLGYKWIAAAQVIWVLAPLKAMETLQANVRAASYVAGSTKTLFVRNLVLMILTCFYMWVGTKFGLAGALAASGMSSLTALFITLILAKSFGSGSFWEPLTVAWRSFVACALMVVAVIFTDYLLRSGAHAPRLLIIVLVKVVVGMVVYTMSHIALWAAAQRPDGFETSVFALLARLGRRIKQSQL